MPVLTFMPQFWDAVRSGAKRHTIRPRRKRPLLIDDPLSLRGWSDRPYMSPQVPLLEAVCTGTEEIRIELGTVARVRRGSLWLTGEECEQLALADGFARWQEMVDWFRKTHGRATFDGVLINWKAAP